MKTAAAKKAQPFCVLFSKLPDNKGTFSQSKTHRVNSCVKNIRVYSDYQCPPSAQWSSHRPRCCLIGSSALRWESIWGNDESRPERRRRRGEGKAARSWMDVSHLLKMEEKMSHYSQHHFPKDCVETEPIIIVIDCLVQFLPLGNIRTWAFALGHTLLRFECLGEASTINLLYMFSHATLMKTEACAWARIISCRLILKRALLLLLFLRHGAAVGDQGRLQQILGTIGGSEGASRGWCAAEVFRQLFRTAVLHLE